MNTHSELIECPGCKTAQWADVEHTEPFYTYVHECENCRIVIMESEWNNILTADAIRDL
jgi:predicted  nucleic acid-binding Zn ribbon protein